MFKRSTFALGWEVAQRQVNASSSIDTAPVTGDIDFVLSAESFDLGAAKPKSERVPKNYFGTTTRTPTMTYDTEKKPGEGSIAGDLRHGHVFDMVIGGVTASSTTSGDTYNTITISGGDRKTFFLYDKHSASSVDRLKSILGCLGTEITVEGKEGEFVTFDVKFQTSKMVTSTELTISEALYDDASNEQVIFQWKHVSTDLTIGGDTYTTLTANQVESFRFTVANNSKLRHGAPSTGGQDNSNWYQEMDVNVELELVLFPEDSLLWDLGPEETSYASHQSASSINCTITLQRSLDDKIVIALTDIQIESISEMKDAIANGIDPATVLFKLGRKTSTYVVTVTDPLYNSGGSYSTVPT